MTADKLSRHLTTLLLVLAGLSLAGCDLFREERLEAYKAPDCDQSYNTRKGFNYYLLGEPGPLINWSGCDKSGSDLRDANLNIAWLMGTNLGGADLRDADLAGAKLAGADLSGADLRGSRLVGADLQGVDLGGADLTGLDLEGISLQRANLAGAKLAGADLRGVNLEGASLEGADLSGAKWIHAPLVCSAGSVGGCQY